jgi:Leucine-rich repeat (LRR) protein
MNWLELDNNRVVDLSPLADMTELRELYVENNQVRIVDPLMKLTSLAVVQGKGNPVSATQSSKLLQALPKCNIKIGILNKIPTRRPSKPTQPKPK